MKKQGWFILLVLGLVICITSAPAHAQDGKFSLFAGYSYGTNDAYRLIDPALHGYSAGVAYNFNKHIGLEANFSGHNGSPLIDSEPATSTENGYNDFTDQDEYIYTFGPKLSLPVEHFTLFTHFLVGGVHEHVGFTDKCVQSSGSDSTCSTTPSSDSSRGNGFAFKTGGGVDWNHGFWGIRILEVDYIHGDLLLHETCTGCTPYNFSSTFNNFELATGVTFNFGSAK